MAKTVAYFYDPDVGNFHYGAGGGGRWGWGGTASVAWARLRGAAGERCPQRVPGPSGPGRGGSDPVTAPRRAQGWAGWWDPPRDSPCGLACRSGTPHEAAPPGAHP